MYKMSMLRLIWSRRDTSYCNLQFGFMAKELINVESSISIGLVIINVDFVQQMRTHPNNSIPITWFMYAFAFIYVISCHEVRFFSVYARQTWQL